MYYGHLDYRKFENHPKLHHDNYDYHESESILPTVFCAILILTFVIASIISYKTTERPSPDGSHIHWSWFGKAMILENGQHASHHYMHPDTCPICKEILSNKDNSKKK